MVRKKKGFWKKIGCLLISTSIILTGWTVCGSLVSEADFNESTRIYTIPAGGSIGSLEASQKAIIETVIAEGDATIGNGALSNCPNLTSVIASGKLTIEPSAFAGDTNLMNIDCEDIVSASASSFSGCASINFNIQNPQNYHTAGPNSGALFSGGTLVYVTAGATKNNDNKYTVPDGTTAIGEDAFSDANIEILEFADATDILAGNFASQRNFPRSGLIVNATNATPETAPAVAAFFEGNNDVVVNFANSVDPINTDPSTTYVIKYKFLGSNDAEESDSPVTINSAATSIPTSSDAPSTYNRKGYVYNKVSGPEVSGNVYTFTYKISSQTVSSYTIGYIIKNSSGTQITKLTDAVTAGTVPAGPASKITVSGKTYEYVSGPDKTLVAATVDTDYTYVYKESSSSSGGSSSSTYTVTVYDEFYKGDLNHMTSSKIRSVNKYSAGASYSFSAAKYTGYTHCGGRNESGTVNGDVRVYFFYMEDGSSKTTTKDKEKKSEINTKLTNKYVITEGANQTVSANGGPVKIVCNGELEKLTGIFVDEVKVDPNRYTLASGSTILTFTSGFVKLFATGDHVVRFEYVDGYAETGLKVTEGKTTTTVTYKVSSDGSISSGHTKDTTPKTADGFDNRYLLCLAIFLLGAGAMMLSKQKKLEAILAGDRDDD